MRAGPQGATSSAWRAVCGFVRFRLDQLNDHGGPESTMTNPGASDESRCARCGKRLRNAVFCPSCNRALCCWACLHAHLEDHPLGSSGKRGPRTEGTGMADFPAATNNDQSSVGGSVPA
jgi:hypothetical protein